MTKSDRKPAEASAGITVDPEFSALIPPLSKEERAQLEANIVRDGILDPIKVWDGVILDGHNRYGIAEAHDLGFEIDEMEFESRDAARVWVIRHQLGRRNLTAFARTELATQLEGILAARSKERQREHGGTAPGKKSLPQKSAEVSGETREQLAKVAGVSRDTVSKVKAIKAAHAEGKVDDETMDKLRSGEVSTNAVATKLKGKPSAAEKAKADREKAAAIKARQDAEAAADDEDEWEEVDPTDPDTPPPLADAKFTSALNKIHDKVMDLIYRSSAPELALIRVRLLALHDEAGGEGDS